MIQYYIFSCKLFFRRLFLKEKLSKDQLINLFNKELIKTFYKFEYKHSLLCQTYISLYKNNKIDKFNQHQNEYTQHFTCNFLTVDKKEITIYFYLTFDDTISTYSDIHQAISVDEMSFLFLLHEHFDKYTKNNKLLTKMFHLLL